MTLNYIAPQLEVFYNDYIKYDSLEIVWKEHNADEDWEARWVIDNLFESMSVRHDQVAGSRITNLREMTAVWDRHTGNPVVLAGSDNDCQKGLQAGGDCNDADSTRCGSVGGGIPVDSVAGS